MEDELERQPGEDDEIDIVEDPKSSDVASAADVATPRRRRRRRHDESIDDLELFYFPVYSQNGVLFSCAQSQHLTTKMLYRSCFGKLVWFALT